MAARLPKGVDDALAAYQRTIAKALVQRATAAGLAGEVAAHKHLRLPVRWDQVNTAVLALVEGYRAELDRGGSEVTTRHEDGTTSRAFAPWLEDGTTALRQGIADLIEASVREGTGPADVAAALRDLFDVEQTRAETIARTEMSRLRNDAAIGRYLKAGVSRMKYLGGPEPCDICRPYIGQTYDADEFPYLPQHPRCVCGAAPVIEVPR